MVALKSLAEGFAHVPDPRQRRGGRHPSARILTLVLLGLLACIPEMAVLERWATVHCEQWREPLGFEREAPPVATTISRVVARYGMNRFATAFLAWIEPVMLRRSRCAHRTWHHAPL